MQDLADYVHRNQHLEWLAVCGYGGGVSTHEMVHGLAGRKTSHWREDTKGIATEEDNIVGMTSHLGLVL